MTTTVPEPTTPPADGRPAEVTAERGDDGSIVLRVSTPAPGSTEERAFTLGPAVVDAIVALAAPQVAQEAAMEREHAIVRLLMEWSKRARRESILVGGIRSDVVDLADLQEMLANIDAGKAGL